MPVSICLRDILEQSWMGRYMVFMHLVPLNIIKLKSNILAQRIFLSFLQLLCNSYWYLHPPVLKQLTFMAYLDILLACFLLLLSFMFVAIIDMLVSLILEAKEGKPVASSSISHLGQSTVTHQLIVSLLLLFFWQSIKRLRRQCIGLFFFIIFFAEQHIQELSTPKVACSMFTGELIKILSQCCLGNVLCKWVLTKEVRCVVFLLCIWMRKLLVLSKNLIPALNCLVIGDERDASHFQVCMMAIMQQSFQVKEPTLSLWIACT